MSTSVYTVKGMTCAGCMNKVTAAVSEVPGVDDVDADISNGEVTVTASDPVDDARIRDAVAGAGYEVTS